MRILFLTFYFEPDLCAGSFRNTSLFKKLLSKIGNNDFIHVITTQPNRYHSFEVEADSVEKGKNFEITRIKLPEHKNGMIDQAKSFRIFYIAAGKIVKNEDYDLVYASSSRLFTAFLGKRIAKSKNALLYLDIRDIFVDTMKDILSNKKYIQKLIIPVINFIEKYTFSNATHINLVSEGFKDYFKKYNKPTYSYYTNGIDDVFIEKQFKSEIPKSQYPVIITYAGNIGNGQGLEKIIPRAAQILGEKYQFKIIGDGGTKALLQDEINKLNTLNVEIISPVSRDRLFEFYKLSTYLFLHLNDFDAFKKVLPSKIFEYGALDKPIIAGVGGYAAQFIKENLTNYILFQPIDVNDFVSQIRENEVKFETRTQFIGKFSREAIMSEMADNILSLNKENS